MSSSGTLLRFLLLAALAILAIAASLLHGSSGMGLRDAWAALTGGGDEMARSIVLDHGDAPARAWFAQQLAEKAPESKLFDMVPLQPYLV